MSVFQSGAKIGFFTEYRYLCMNVTILKHVFIMKQMAYRIIFILLSAVLCLTGCKGVKDIRVTSVNVVSVSPKGFRSMDLVLSVGIDNPTKQVQVSDIEGSLVHSGKIIGRMVADPVTLAARTSQIYAFKANVSLAQGAVLKDLMVLMQPEALEDCTVDVSFKARYGKNATVPLKLKDKPLKELLEQFGNEKN